MSTQLHAPDSTDPSTKGPAETGPNHLLLPPQVIREFDRYEGRVGQVVPKAEAEGEEGADGEGKAKCEQQGQRDKD